MKTLDLSAWSQQDLMFLLIATFLVMIVVIIALLFYLRRTRPRPADSGQPEDAAPPPEITVRRKAWAGRMEVVVNGRAYRRMKDIDDPAVRRAVVLAVGDLVTFAGEAAGIAPQTAPTAPETPAGEAPTAGKQYAPPKELAEHALLAQLEDARLRAQPPEGWLGALARGMGGRPAYNGSSRGFVEEIEGILQRRRMEKGIPQEIHVRTDGQGIVRLEVDGVMYDGPGDIPDLNVKELIRAAVGEWEAVY